MMGFQLPPSLYLARSWDKKAVFQAVIAIWFKKYSSVIAIEMTYFIKGN